MEDRIQINGIWYVKAEDDNDLWNEEDALDVLWSKNCLYETQDYCWEASRCITDVEDYDYMYDPRIDFYIEFTDKTTKPWKTDHWDNSRWVLGVLHNDPEAMKEARKEMDEQGIKDFRKFIKFLIEKGWMSINHS